MRLLTRSCCSFTLLAAAVQASAVPCTLDEAPAATLLVPYFAVDVAACAETERVNTLFTVTNPSRQSVLTKVTIWSNAGLPVFDFDIYLQGFGTQAVSMADILCSGNLPSTGSGVAEIGQFTDAPASFPNCNATSDPQNGAPLYANPAIASAQLDQLQAQLQGQDDGSGQCVAIDTGSGLAEGYITIDTVSECSSLTPADSAYYSGTLSFNNTLTGSFQQFDPSNNSSVGFNAVAIEAVDGGDFANGDTSFYGRFNNGDASDRREPLPTTFQASILNDSGYDNNGLIVWREVAAGTSSFACGGAPSWYPLTQSNQTGFSSRGIFAIDESGTAVALSASTPFPAATQRSSLAAAFPDDELSFNGSLWLNLQHSQTVYAGNGADRFGQAWVGELSAMQGRFAEGIAAPAMDNSCTSASFDVTSPGPRTNNPSSF